MRPFLTARWEHLLFLNYRCSADLLQPHVPAGTTLDTFEGETLVSLVAFRFRETRLRGFSIPFHRHFEEANLRFYVRREEPDGEIRRGVVFIRELVPRPAIALVARQVYNEPYLAVPMHQRVRLDAATGGSVEYGWRYRGLDYAMRAEAEGPATPSAPGSQAEFITEHYWGYTRQRDGGTLSYRVEHPRWPLWTARNAQFKGEATPLYGNAFAEVLRADPVSAFIAPGSDVAVYPGYRL